MGVPDCCDCSAIVPSAIVLDCSIGFLTRVVSAGMTGLGMMEVFDNT